MPVPYHLCCNIDRRSDFLEARHEARLQLRLARRPQPRPHLDTSFAGVDIPSAVLLSDVSLRPEEIKRQRFTSEVDSLANLLGRTTLNDPDAMDTMPNWPYGTPCKSFDIDPR